MLYNIFMSTIFLSEKTNDLLKSYLREHGHHIIEIKRTNAVYDAVSSHADIYLCRIGKELIVSGEQLPMIFEELERCGIAFSTGCAKLGHDYPDNVKYNGAQVGDYFIHNIKITDPELIHAAEYFSLKMIHVSQGYTKCNLVIVDDHSVITSDSGIYKALTAQKIDVLLISKGHVALHGFPYGFLGGASGRVGNEILFNGDLSAHPDFKTIKNFIRERSLQVRYFVDYPLDDIGSIIKIPG